MKHKPNGSLVLRILVYGAAFLTVCEIVFLVGYILIKGIRHLTPSLFSLTYNSENVSLLPALINTLFMAAISLIIATVLGIGAAIYLSEYAKSTNKAVKLIRLAAETLSGIPSIAYGLFGALFFVKFLKFGLSLLSGALTLSIMILPLILRTTEEALRAVPENFREGSFGLGAGRLRTVFCIVLPSAMPGIMSGIILSIGRIVGESAALVYTAGTVPEIASTLTSSARTLAVHMYTISGEGLYINQTYATAVVLLIIVIVMNTLSDVFLRSFEKRRLKKEDKN